MNKKEKCFTEFDLNEEVSAFRKPALESYDKSSECKESKKRKSSLTIEPSSEKRCKIIKEGIVDKKCGWLFYYNRKFKLTSEPRLSYYNPKTNEYRVCK